MKIWSRIARMGWDERLSRLTQEASKRFDVTLYRCGVLSDHEDLKSSQLGGKFFFSPVELLARVEILKRDLTQEVDSILREADDICGHRFRLLGYDPLDYGAEIDWHFDAVHGVRAPMKPWYSIRFLNFDEVGDHKVIWELNRHQHLVTLAKAWMLIGDARYVAELKAQWHSWQRANPYPMGINWGSSLEVAFRSLSWLWILALLSDAAVGADFRLDVMRGLARNGKYIERYLSTYFSPNTHLIGEAVALFFIGTLCPEISGAARWREKGWEILLKEAQRQVRPDGVYFEQSLYYHVYALDFFLHARILAARNEMDIPADFDAVLHRMLDVLALGSQAGVAEGFGDDDGGRVFNPGRNRSEHLTDPLALGAVIFHRQDVMAGAGLTEEAIWLFGDDAVSCLGAAARRGKSESALFEAGGLYVMASGYDSAMQMIVDAGPQGTGRSGHGHADALSVSLAMGGRRWLVDSGAFTYMGTERDEYRGTRAHNTLRVDELDQAVPDGPFGWTAIPEVHCKQWIAGRGFSFFSGMHNGYMRLDSPVRHRREIFYLHDEFWLVRDLADGHDDHEIEINWHFAPGIRLERMANAVAASLGHGNSGPSLTLFSLPESTWEETIEGGFVSPAYGRREAASILRSAVRTRLPVERATLLKPVAADKKAGAFSREATESVNAYLYAEPEKRHTAIFWNTESADWSWNGWNSDARLLYFCAESERISHLIFCNGSKVTLDGRPVVVHPYKIERLEFDMNSGQVYSSDKAALESFSRAALEGFIVASSPTPNKD